MQQSYHPTENKTFLELENALMNADGIHAEILNRRLPDLQMHGPGLF